MRVLSRVVRAVYVVALLNCVAGESRAIEPPTVFSPGDAVVGIYYDELAWLRPDLTTRRVLDGGGWGFDCPDAFDPFGRLLVANFNVRSFAVLDIDGSLLRIVATGLGNPRTISLDSARRVYVGHSHSVDVEVFSPDYSGLGRVRVTDGGTGVQGSVILGDDCTYVYTSGTGVYRFDLCTQQQLPELSPSLPGTYAQGLDRIPDGGYLVADTESVLRLDALGTIVRSYDVASADSWMEVSHEPGGATFLAGDYESSQLYRFDLETGAVLDGPIQPAGETFTLCGLVVYDGPELLLFADGFESGDTSMWTGLVPRPNFAEKRRIDSSYESF